MPRMYFNWKLAFVLIISVVVVGATAFGLRKWQRSNRAENSLELGIKAYDAQNWDDAAKHLGTYVGVARDDVPILLKYAQSQLNRRPRKSSNVRQAINTYRIVLRVDNSHLEAATELTKLYLAMNMPGEAELIASRFPDITQNHELNRLWALSLAAQRKFEQAAQELKNIVTNNPDQILAYESLGRLNKLRPELFSVSPIHWLDESVSNNPSSALAYTIRAGFHLANNDRPAALADLDQARKLDMEDFQVRLRLASTLINMGLLDEAKKHLQIVQAVEPTDMGLWQTWVQWGVKSGSNEEMQSIAEAGLEAMAAQPWDFMPMAAEIFIQNKKYDSAEKCIEQLNQNEMNPASTAFLEGLLAQSKGNNYEAVKCWQRAIQLGNSAPHVRLSLALLLSRLGNVQSALQHLNSLLTDNPNYFQGHIAIARLFSEIADWPKAAESAQKAMRISPSDLDAAMLYYQARIRLLSANQADNNPAGWDDIQKRLSVLDKASGGSMSVKLMQFQAALSHKKYVQAQNILTQLKEKYPSEIQVAMCQADLLVAGDKIDQAISELTDIVEQFPESFASVKQLAVLLVRQDNNVKCEQVLKDALKRIKTPVDSRKLNLMLVELYTQWQRQEDAYKLLDAFAKANPDDIPVKHSLLGYTQVFNDPDKSQQIINDIKTLEGEQGWQWKYEQAKLWFATEDIEEYSTRIITLLKENLLSNPGDLPNLVLLAATYEKSASIQLAISTYRQALDRSPGDMRIIIPLVATLYKANEYDQADEILNNIPDDKAYHPSLSKLQLQSYLRHGQLDSASETLDMLLTKDPENQAARLSLALLKMRQEKYDQAEKLLNEIKAHDPESLSVIAAQVQLNILKGNADQAIKICNDTVDKLKTVPAYLFRAKIYSSLGQTAKAIEDYDQAIAMEPENIEVWVNRSDFYRTINQPDKAIADIKQAMILDSSNIQINKRAIPLLVTSQDADLLKEGQQLLAGSLLSQPEDVELLLIKSQLLISKNSIAERQEATQILKQLTEDHPEVSQAWLSLGDIMLRQGKSIQALDAAMRGLSYKVNDKSLLLLKGRAEAIRSAVLAVPTYQMLQELYPDDFDVVMYLAKAYVDAKEYNKAENLMAEQLSIRKDETEIKQCTLALSVAMYKNGDKDKAEQKLDLLLNTYPDDRAVILTHTKLLIEDKQWSKIKTITGDWFKGHSTDTQTPVNIADSLVQVSQDAEAIQAAESILEMVIDKVPDDIRSLKGLAIIKQMTKRNQEAVKLYQLILENDPENVVVMNNLAWILCEDQGKYQQALELTNKGLGLTPGYTDMIDTRGMVYYRMGEFNEAIQDFSRCVEMYPSGTPVLASSYFHLGKAFAGLRETDKAVKNLRTSLDMASRVGGLSPEDNAESRNLIKALLESN